MKKLVQFCVIVVVAMSLAACATKSFYVAPTTEGGTGYIVEEKDGAWEIILNKNSKTAAAATVKALNGLKVEAKQEALDDSTTVFKGKFTDKEPVEVSVRGLASELSTLRIQIESEQEEERVRQVATAVSKEL